MPVRRGAEMTLARDDNTAGGMPRTASGSADAFRAAEGSRSRRVRRPARDYGWLIMTAYIVFLMLPIYWLINMSVSANEEIPGALTLWPRNPTLHNYMVIFTDPSCYWGYLNSIIYVVMNSAISVLAALPAAYAF